LTERGIPFSTPLVRAILEDRKAQTRRVIVPQPEWRYPGNYERGGVHSFTSGQHHITVGFGGACEVWSRRCPYGVPGDLLYVRETWNLVREWGVDYNAVDGGREVETGWESWKGPIPKEHPEGWLLEYRATDEALGGPWRPTIHMPKWAARIWLELTGVRVERIQDIPTDDIIAEGIQIPVSADKGHPLIRVTGKYPPVRYLRKREGKDWTEEELFRAHFASTWDELNTKRGYSWESNPWVWVLDFKRRERDA
jgi:hypothetical protein